MGKSIRIPGSTYRLQFNRSFTLAQAEELLDYFAALGITDLYSSPIFPAGPDSTHGYDVCGFDQINPALGTPEQFASFCAALRVRGIGLLLDIVPNHMGACAANCLWRDVLKHGRASEFASFFDIDWFPPNPTLREKVLLPILGDHYGQVLTRGEFKLVLENDEPQLAYFDQRFPLSPKSEEKLREEGKWRSPSSSHGSAESLGEILAEYNADAKRLHSIIEKQNYRLAYWRVGPHELNYRRFFDVTSLVAVRVEDEAVFQRTHQFIFELLKSGAVTGLRVDHPDGLRDPKTYFDRLQQHGPVFVTAEKILSEGEHLPSDWKVAGTTGYDFLVVLNSLFVDPAGEQAFNELLAEITGDRRAYGEIALESKRHVLQNLFPVEVDSLTARLKQIASETIEGIDFARHELREAIVEFAAAFPVYRTYTRSERPKLEPEESRFVTRAIADVSHRKPALQPALEFLRKVLEGDVDLSGASEFVFRFQQLTGPATAKGLEDTAFYRYTRFVSLNEVGGNPGRFGISIAEFHRHNEDKARDWPHAQLATATHDTKRGEDFRARLNVLSEIPEEWRTAVHRWRAIAESSSDRPAPADEYLLFQTLVGTWTAEAEQDVGTYIERVQNYVIKAVREAKVHTSWTEQNSAYEQALTNFVAWIISNAEFLADFKPFQKRVSFFGVFNSLSQLVLKICSPGVPDFYQGTELWDFNMVDPDNRRPVNFEQRQNLLATVKSTNPAALLGAAESGAVKMAVMARLLAFRQGVRACFDSAKYTPLAVTGPVGDHLCAFSRSTAGQEVVVLAPRLIAKLLKGREVVPVGHGVWDATRVSISGRFRNILTGEMNNSGLVAEILKTFPVAVLEKISP